MKGNMKKKLLAVLAAIAMVLAMVIPVSAQNYTTAATVATSKYPTFMKVIDLPTDQDVPECGFKFNIVPANDIAATDSTYAVIAGVTSSDNKHPSIAPVVFAQGTAKDGTTYTGATKGSSCTQYATVSFEDVEFSEPGVYRYIITEEAADNYNNFGIGYDEDEYMILDVYVIDNNGSLEVSDFIFSKTSAIPTSGPANDITSGEKTEAFINIYPVNTLEVLKEVTGNQGSKDEYFKFTISATEPTNKTIDANKEFLITGLDSEDNGNLTENSATTGKGISFDTIKTQNAITRIKWSQLKAGYDIYLQNGDHVSIIGLLEGTTYTIKEENGSYTTQTKTMTGTQTKNDVSGVNGNSVNGSLTESTKQLFINDKTGTIPTGVLLSATGLIVVGLIVVIGVVFFGIRSKKRYEED